MRDSSRSSVAPPLLLPLRPSRGCKRRDLEGRCVRWILLRLVRPFLLYYVELKSLRDILWLVRSKASCLGVSSSVRFCFTPRDYWAMKSQLMQLSHWFCFWNCLSYIIDLYVPYSSMVEMIRFNCWNWTRDLENEITVKMCFCSVVICVVIYGVLVLTEKVSGKLLWCSV